MMLAAISPRSPEVVRCKAPRRSTAFLILKRSVQMAFTVLALPRLMAYFACRRLLGRRAFGACSESIGLVPGLRGVYLRQAFYRQTLARCGQDVYFGWQ